VNRFRLAIFVLLLGASILQLNFNTSPEFGRLPVQHEGRIKPLDTVARNTLLLLRGKQALPDRSATEWLMGLTMNADSVRSEKVFRIDHPDLLALLSQTEDSGPYYSLDAIAPYLEKVREQAMRISDPADSYERGVIALWQQATLYFSLSHTLFVSQAEDPVQELRVFELATGKNDPELMQWFEQRYALMATLSTFQPVPGPDGWTTVGHSLLESTETGKLHPVVPHIAKMISAYRAEDTVVFNTEVNAIAALTRPFAGRTHLEHTFNQLQPFSVSIFLYTAAFLTALASWSTTREWVTNLMSALVTHAFAVHSIGLLTRMIIDERPPVTNLYSSAIFIGWAAVLGALLLEKIHRNTLGVIAAAIIGGTTLIVAHHMAASGDTIEMMRAVLNSNFWLSTHVVTITLGYSATFLAGLLAAIAIVRGNPQITRAAQPMIYGVICIALLFSFVGTVLGGIWADQSWGRFWGWDPKENGALMIVLWNAAILHARWGGIIQTRGLLCMAVAGNIITSFSWFGVNLLGVGLHSYGFIDGTFGWLTAFIISQLILIGWGATRLRRSGASL
jgi:ABC-type transport system involved in cytochrome c biogenesis permease subunit